MALLRRQDIRRAVLPVLAKLLAEPEVREEVPHVLSRLLANNKELQAAAADADAVSKLAGFLRREDCSQRLKVPARLSFLLLPCICCTILQGLRCWGSRAI